MPIDVDSAISGKHVFVESGVHVIGEVHIISGFINVGSGVIDVVINLTESSGLFVEGISGVHVFQESGAVVGISGQHVVVDPVGSSGLFVDGVSGVHIFVESGVHVVADVDVIVSSGLWVDGISGVHVFQESGAVVGISGQAVMVGYCVPEQGDPIVTRLLTDCSGALILASGGAVQISGQHVVVDPAGSSGLFVEGISGVHVFQESGAVVGISGQHVVVDPAGSSGLFVDGVSGVHVFVESGVGVLVSGQQTAISGHGAQYPFNPETDDNAIDEGEVRECPVVLMYGSDPEAGSWKRWGGTPDVSYGLMRMWVITQPDIGVSGTVRSLISGDHVYVESGPVVGISGQHVVVDPTGSSGLFVEGISGVHVYQESGAHVIANLSGEGSVMTIIDLSGNPIAISERHEGVIVTPDIMREVHKGEIYYVSICRSGLEADADLEMLIFPASGKELHCTFGINTGGAGQSCLYENIAFDTSGTPVTVHNMNRFCSGQPDTLVTVDPTNSSGGICLWCDIQGGPGNRFGGGGPGATRSDTPWVLTSVSGVIPYLLRVKNTETEFAKDAQLSMTFSEEEPLCWHNG